MKTVPVFIVAFGALGVAQAQSFAAPRATNPALEQELKRVSQFTEQGEIRSGRAELELLELRDQFNAPEELGAIYAAASRLPFDDQPFSMQIRHAYRRLAMEHPLDALTRAELYRSGAALPWDLIEWRDLSAAARLEARPAIASAYLEGLRWMLEEGISNVQQKVPAVSMVDHIYFDEAPPPEVQAALEEHESALQAVEQVRYRNELVIQRWLLSSEIVALYREGGEAQDLDELEEVATSVLGPAHAQAVQGLLEAAEAEHPLFHFHAQGGVSE